MPCRSDYLQQNDREAELQRAAKLYKFVLQKQNKQVPAKVAKTAEAYYAKEDFVPDLCYELRKMDDDDLDRIVYNARNKTSRDLADWWEEHQEADRKREKQEKYEKQMNKLRKQVVNKLTKKELESLRQLLTINGYEELEALRLRADEDDPDSSNQ